MRAACLLLGALAAGCVPAMPEPATGLGLLAGPRGLIVTGTIPPQGSEIALGRARDGALASVARVEGRAPRPVPCPVAGLDGFATAGGLTLVFDADSFVGLRGADGTGAGLGCGTG